MINKDFFSALEDLEKEKNIKKEEFIEILETALTSAYKKNFGQAKSAFVKLIPEKHTIKVFAYKKVVDEVEDPDKEIVLAEAKELSAKYKVGDIITEEVTPKAFGRIAAQTAKHIIMQKIHEVEKGNLLQEINGKENEIVTGVVRRIDGKNVFLEIGGTTIDAVLNEYEQVPGEPIKLNQKMKVFVKQIKDGQFGPQIVVSRKNVGYIRRLFELEVPEIETGEVEIKNIARDAGNRTKIAVYSENKNIDPVGACIGNKGMRINSIMSELNGEKIDIIEYSEDPFEYIASALSPAEVISVEINSDENVANVIVPEDKLSLAIGKGGQNVRLAARLTGWKIDVKAKTDAVEAEEPEAAADAEAKLEEIASIEELDGIAELGDIDILSDLEELTDNAE